MHCRGVDRHCHLHLGLLVLCGDLLMLLRNASLLTASTCCCCCHACCCNSVPLHASMSNLASPNPLPCRVGRTARAGRRGWSLSFVTQYDIELVQQIEVGVGLTALSLGCQAVWAVAPDGILPCNCIQASLLDPC